jgi:hypothetical protein
MRQVGDRLIPVGISSGRVQVIDEGSAAAAQDGEGSRRRRRRDREIGRMLGLPTFNSANYPGGVIGTQDLEEVSLVACAWLKAGTLTVTQLMIAEAMRQSVLEEEERQRKEQEKAAKGGTTAATPASDAGPSASSVPSSSAPQSALHLPAVTGASLLPPTAPDDRGRLGHRPSSSISALQPDAAADGATPTGSLRARSQPPFSALSAALRGAASAASAIGAPGKRREGNASGSGANTPVVAPNPPPAPVPVPLPTPPMDASASTSTKGRATTPHLPTPPLSAPSISEPVQIYLPQQGPANADESDLAALASIPATAFAASGLSAARPIPTHTDSFASAVTVDSEATVEPYDVLSSSPESDAGTAPLLRGEAPPAAAGLGEAAQTPGLVEGKPLGEA